MLNGTAPRASELDHLRSARSEDRLRATAGANRAGKANASGTVLRAKSGAKANGNCEDGPRARTGADKAENANRNHDPRPWVTHA